MSIRTLAASSTVAAALLAAPAASVAYPVHDAGAAGASQAGYVALQSAPPAPALDESGSGTGTVLVVAIAGATLLIGAAGGFEGARVAMRRHPVS
jgi:hypothetical protein